MQEQHPIPQQISSYQFRLVGDMTLKQFFQLAGGVMVSLLFYASPLHPAIKWPFIILFVLLGIALAFLPFEERPLEKWILAFFRSIYSPTIFGWSKAQIPVKYFQEEAVSQLAPQFVAPQGNDTLNAYLATPTTHTTSFRQLEHSEQTFLTRMGDLFAPGSPQKGVVSLPVATQNPQTPPPPAQTSNIGSTQIPQTPLIKAVGENRTRVVVEETALPPDVQQAAVSETIQAAPPQVQVSEQAIFSTEAAPPHPPTIPNTISGQVMDPDGKIVEGAILEIRDVSGRPVRALRSNKLGHFLIVTALLNGAYEIITEKDGLEFKPVSFETTGGIVPPIAIKAVARNTPPPVAESPTPNTAQVATI